MEVSRLWLLFLDQRKSDDPSRRIGLGAEDDTTSDVLVQNDLQTSFELATFLV